MDEQEYKQQVLAGQKKKQGEAIEKILIYVTAFAIAMVIFSILRICEVEWTMNRSLTECICYLIGASLYLIIFFLRKKIFKLILKIKDKFVKE
ncbi:MAG: hypothetical protein IJ325_02255 [Clostridia bacterium]|nr:hypothetical protein [Clostridia bacterium]